MTPNEIAEQLVTEWQKQDRMPPMAWDFRGFAAAAAAMAADAEREACAAVCAAKAKALGEHADLCDDDEEATELKAQAWQMTVLAAELRLRSNT